jgi:hypothetical protein
MHFKQIFNLSKINDEGINEVLHLVFAFIQIIISYVLYYIPMLLYLRKF